MKGSLLKLNCLIFFYRSKQFTDYIHTDIYCKVVNCQNALDRLRVHMNIILFTIILSAFVHKYQKCI